MFNSCSIFQKISNILIFIFGWSKTTNKPYGKMFQFLILLISLIEKDYGSIIITISYRSTNRLVQWSERLLSIPKICIIFRAIYLYIFHFLHYSWIFWWKERYPNNYQTSTKLSCKVNSFWKTAFHNNKQKCTAILSLCWVLFEYIVNIASFCLKVYLFIDDRCKFQSFLK